MEELKRSALTARIGLVAGPVAFFLLLFFWRADAMGVVGSLTAWMAIWWMTEAIPIPATALLPLVVLPLLAGQTFELNAVAMNYANWRVYLFFGGFLIAIAMERTGLHRRIALKLVRRVGTSPRRLVFGFMLATAFLSMWISNTATTLMMLPIGLAVISELPGRPRFAVALMLGIAYGATIGGVSTLVGTPPNITFLGELALMFPEAPDVAFARWLGFALPLAILFLPLAWLVLVRKVEREKGANSGAIDAEIAALGPLRASERRVLMVFVATALLWIFRKDIVIGAFTIPGWIRLLPHEAVNDGVVAMAMGLSLFLIPGERGRILDWDTVKAKMPWGLLLLFGGGFALAFSIRTSGLAAEVGRQFGFLAGAHPVLLIGACSSGVTFLTEVTSNTATAEILLPLVGGIAAGPAGVDPRVMMLPVTLAASCAFMLPVATPPNAVVFGSGYVRMNDMVRHGLIMNLIGIVLVTLVCYLLGPIMFGIDLTGGVPDWAQTPVTR
jgi:sodium-dependent dicarboxylate transporter 2/3/5